MDKYMIISITIILAIIVAIILITRHYQNVRVKTGYHKGKMYKVGQQMGAMIGDYHMNNIGADEADKEIKTDPVEEMYLFTESPKE